MRVGLKESNQRISSAALIALKAAVAVLAVANAAAFAYIFYSKTDAVLRNNPYPLIDLSRNFISQENYIVNIQPLREELRAMAHEFGDDSISIYIEFLNTGANISINPDAYIWPASLLKVPLAMAVMKKIENGSWHLGNELILTAGDKDDRSGSLENPLWEYPVGTRFSIEQLLQELLINSDNTAHNILYRNMHFDDVKMVLEELGLEALFASGGKMNAKEYSRMFRSLYSASFLNRGDSQKILEWLDLAVFDNYLSHKLPQDIPFPHKYGENIDFRVYSDSGIVYLPQRPYLITVMIQGDPSKPVDKDDERAAEFMQNVSKKVYEYFSAY